MGITRKQARIAIENKLSIQEIQKQFDENFTEMHFRVLYNYAYKHEIPSFELYGIKVYHDLDYPNNMQVDIMYKPIANGELTNYDMLVSKRELFDAFVNGTVLIEEMVNKYYNFKNGLSDKKKEDEYTEDEFSKDDSDECYEYEDDSTESDSIESIKIKELENKITRLENRIAQLENFRRIGF